MTPNFNGGHSGRARIAAWSRVHGNNQRQPATQARRSRLLRRGACDETVARMDADRPTRILVVANRTAGTARLLDEVNRRALAGPCEFALLIPDVGRDRKHPDWTLASALPLMRRAAGGRVGSVAGGADPLASIHNALTYGDFDEIIVSTRPVRFPRLRRRDLVDQVQRLGLPVTVLLPHGATVSNKQALAMMFDAGGPGGY